MNAETSVQWAPALVVLGAGLIVGFALVWRLLSASRRAVKAGAAALEARDLAGKSEMLFRQLRELEDTASKRTPEQLARERYALELEAAKALLELEKKGPSVTENVASAKAKSANPEPSVATPSVATRDRSGMRGFLWGVGSAAGVLLLGFFVYQSARPREAGG
ncbi:MAG: hypothetical protein E6J65_03990, partial [Deltaproteobacteria bacterium]